MPVEVEVRLLRADDPPPEVVALTGRAPAPGVGTDARRGTRRASVVAGAALRLFAAELGGRPAAAVDFGPPGPHGRPTLTGVPDDLDANLSHSGPHLAVAVAAGARVGVDIEQVAARRDLGALARRVLGEEELAVWEARAPADRVGAFLRTWTRKEAHRKAEGTGLAGGVRDLDASDAPAGWTWRDLDAVPGLVGSVSVAAPRIRLRVAIWVGDGRVLPVA